MGREVKRVSLNFTWPLNKVWEGYLNPYWNHSKKCKDCDGMGYSPFAKNLHDMWYGYVPFSPEQTGSKPFLPTTKAIRALAERNVTRSPSYYGKGESAIQKEAERLCQHFNKNWMYHLSQEDVDVLFEKGRLRSFTHHPTAEEVNEWSISGLGHDSTNQWICIKNRCKKANEETSCPICKGEGHIWDSVENEKLYEEWQSYEPPAGEGYQLWETTSEGSPVSPVFDTPEKLADYLASHGVSSFGYNTETYDTWLKFIKGTGWSVSAVMDSDGMKSGVKAMADENTVDPNEKRS